MMEKLDNRVGRACTAKLRDTKGRFVKGHKILNGSEKGWFKKGNKGYWLGKTRSKKTKKKISKAFRGYKWPKEIVKKRIKAIREKYKDFPVSKASAHRWIISQKGKPNRCELCGTTKAKKFEWANKNHKYLKKLEDWMRVCTPCHRKYDRQKK